jgi:hypothetical protein
MKIVKQKPLKPVKKERERRIERVMQRANLSNYNICMHRNITVKPFVQLIDADKKQTPPTKRILKAQWKKKKERDK